MASYKYDVFISYSGKDRGWVKNKLLPKLMQKDIKYCIDYRDFPAGKSAIYNMRDAVKKSRQTLLVMTPHWVKSEWTAFESLLVRGTDPAGIRQRTIPLMVTKCKVDDILSMLTWVNLAQRGSKAIAWNQLYTALGKRPAPKQKRQVHKKISANWNLAHPYPMPPNFTGRNAERIMLSRWLSEDKQHPLLVLRALGGFGKSALSWYWLTHDVDPAKWQKVVFWSFYEGDASFENFLKETLQYLGFPNLERLSTNEQTTTLLNLLQDPGILLIIDGFERALRAYGNMGAVYQADEVQKDKNSFRDTSRDCVSPSAEVFLRSLSAVGNFAHSKVLMTTRLTPRAVEHHGGILEGCLEKELKAMDKDDAVKFFRNEGVRGIHTEIQEICSQYGFHPLSLRLLVGLVVNDLRSPGDIAVAGQLDISNDIIQNKHHVLEQAYKTMSKARRKLLSQIACFRSPVIYEDLKSIIVAPNDTKSSNLKERALLSKKKSLKPKKAVQPIKFDNDLRDLLSRGLLNHDTKTNRYDLHPIVRNYAYDRLTAADRTGAHERLVNYFEAVPKPKKVVKLEDLATVIELYHHMVRAGKLDEAWNMFIDRLHDIMYFQFGAYQSIIELMRALFTTQDSSLPNLTGEGSQTWCLSILGNSYALSGQPRHALPLFESQIAIQEERGSIRNVAIALGNLTLDQIRTGALSIAESNLRRKIDLCLSIQDIRHETIGHEDLGHLLSYCGQWEMAEQELKLALDVYEKQNDFQGQSVLWSYLAERFLLMARVARKSYVGSRKLAIEAASHALEMADKTAKQMYPYPRDYVRAYWLLGSAYNASRILIKAEENISKASSMCRQINMVDMEANILLDLARLRYDQKKYEEANSLAEEALTITERCDYVLQGADVNLFLAQYALKQEKDKVKAKEYAETALKLAYCDGPPHYYKVAYEEAERMLEKLKG